MCQHVNLISPSMPFFCSIKGLGIVFPKMPFIRIEEITKVLVEYLKEFATRFNRPGRFPKHAIPTYTYFRHSTHYKFCFNLLLTVVVCQFDNGALMQADLPPPLFLKTACRQNIQSDAQWLAINLGPFSTVVNYSDLKDLNITGVKRIKPFMFL